MLSLSTQQAVTFIAALFILVVLFLAGVLDVWFGGKYGQAATISYQIQNWCQKYPVLYIALAWLLFHLTSLPCNETVIETKDGNVTIVIPKDSPQQANR